MANAWTPIVAPIAVALLLVGAAGAGRSLASTQGTVPRTSELDRARQRLEGSFELEEWKVGGTVLRPPQVEGRFSVHDGLVMIMTVRKDLPVPETAAGYGTYRFENDTFTYGYTHHETVRADADGKPSRRVSGPMTFPLRLEWQGDLLLVIGQGADRREYLPDGFSSPLGNTGDYRRWKRLE
ncbi:MAG: hypothetical protein AB7N65_08150 [Vicinamibacterales bacterium]